MCLMYHLLSLLRSNFNCVFDECDLAKLSFNLYTQVCMYLIVVLRR